MAGVIDFRAFVPTKECLESISSPPPGIKRYADKYHMASRHLTPVTPDALVSQLDACGIDHTVLAGLGITNDAMAEFISGHTTRLSGIAAISPIEGLSRAVCEVRRAHSLGLRMVGLRPFIDRIRASDRSYYPIYAICVELGMGVVIHTSFNFGRGLLDFGRPLHLDEVAADFPELIIVASHGGWPWVPEMVGVAWHNDNVFVEMSSHRVRYMAQPGSGWESLFNYGDGPLRSRLLWGSVSPWLDLKQQLAETHELPLKETTIAKMLDANPRELLARLGLDAYDSSQ